MKPEFMQSVIGRLVFLAAALHAPSSGAEQELTLERSTNLQAWEKVTLDASMLTAEGTLRVGGELPVFYRMDIHTVAGIPENMVLVEGGTLAMSMGTVAVSSFYIGQYEVTWGEWQEVRTWAADNGYDIGSVGYGCANDHPVIWISWFDAAKWCNARSEKERLTPGYTHDGGVYRMGEFGWDGSVLISWNTAANGYRLPSEAEWEFAARGGNDTHGYTYSGSNDLNTVGWYVPNSAGAPCAMIGDRGTWPVGQKSANELGLYDMSGNVQEWCWDAQSSAARYLRGGSFQHNASGCTVSYRGSDYPDHRTDYVGFRLARNAVP